MSRHQAESQLSLFEEPVDAEAAEETRRYLEARRAEVLALLDIARASSRIPWRDGLEPIMVHNKVRRICERLPDGAPLLALFEAELDRLWDIENALPDGL